MLVFEDYKIVYSNQFGIKSTNSKKKINENAAFSTASIAEPIPFMCHILEEKGLINLDEPIDKYLKRWHLPKSKLRKTSPAWKQFLNHTGGDKSGQFWRSLCVRKNSEFRRKPFGEIPRYEKEIEFLFTPGSDWKYSGGGYTIIQMALEDTFGQPIAALADEYIFSPLGLKNTMMIQPNENSFLTNVALVHDKEGKAIKQDCLLHHRLAHPDFGQLLPTCDHCDRTAKCFAK